MASTRFTSNSMLTIGTWLLNYHSHNLSALSLLERKVDESQMKPDKHTIQPPTQNTPEDCLENLFL